MAFVVNDIVKKVGTTQKYWVCEILENSKYACKLYPKSLFQGVTYTFKEADLELAT